MKKKLHLFFCLICLCLFVKGQHIIEKNKIHSQGLNINLNCYYNPDYTGSRQILFVHGLTYSSHEFHVDYQDYSLVRFMVNNGYKVWSVDITGYGESDKPNNGFDINTSYAAMDIKNAVDYILKREKIGQIDMLAWSWGTATSSEYLVENSEQVRKLILYAPITSGYDGNGPTSDWHRNSWTHAASDFQIKNQTIDTNTIAPAVMHTFLSNCWKYDKAESPNGGRKDLLQGKSHRFIKKGQLNLPVLFIGGTNDPFLKWEEIETLYIENKDKFDGQMIQIKGGGHALLIEKPFYRNFHNYILNFLKVN